MKRIVTLQDISCIGKCSLTAALPVLSSMGIETAILPTAVLSTHTMFRDPVFIDLTDYIAPIAEHWKREGFSFDAIYTGYLGSIRQIDLISRFIDDFSASDAPDASHPLILVDPAMADHGRLYSGFDTAFVEKMKDLCSKADLIVPNMTEAALLTGLTYQEEYDRSYPEELLDRLALLGPSRVVLTGVSLSPHRLGVMGKDSRTGDYFTCDAPRQERSYHGTGDLFASVLLGCLVNDQPLDLALQTACDYISRTIGSTIANPNSRSYGVDFETTLKDLVPRQL